MSHADGSGMKERNIRRLRNIASLVPNHGITVECTFQLLTWYLSSIKLDSEAHKREVEAYERELEVIKVQLRERDEAHKRE